MEALGTLAGGIAHDFNNILSAIMGYTELVGLDLDRNSDSWKNLEQVIKASNRAKDLIRHILSFSRQTKKEREPIQIAPIIKETAKLLKASLPSFIEIRTEVDKNLGYVMADPTQIHQIVLNLCTNAAFAMRETGGTLLHRPETDHLRRTRPARSDGTFGGNIFEAVGLRYRRGYRPGNI